MSGDDGARETEAAARSTVGAPQGRLTEPQSAEPQSAEGQSAEAQGAEAQGAEAQGAEAQSAESHTSEAQNSATGPPGRAGSSMVDVSEVGDAEPGPDAQGADDAVIDDLLVKTSRTFALAIPLLPEPTYREVALGYLLFRIADTFEDASVHWRRSRQRQALAEFAELMRGAPTSDAPVEEAGRLASGWTSPPPSDHDGYLELVEETPRVIRSFKRLSPEAQDAIARHTERTAELMSNFVERSDEEGDLRLENLAQLRDYCYAVAGIVGEMLTDLFILGSPLLEASREFLSERAARFGEGLQLVNILKDSASDATEGRFYLPAAVDRGEVFDLAHRDLHLAAEYVLEIQRRGGPDGVVAFTALPVELARASLDRVQEAGAGSKLTRPEVFEIHDRVHRAIAEKRPALPL